MKSKTKQDAALAGRVAARLAGDTRFRAQVASAAAHGLRAREQAQRTTRFATLRRLGQDEVLRAELTQMVRDLQDARSRATAVKERVEIRGRNRRMRRALLILAGGAAAVGALPQLRTRIRRVAEARRTAVANGRQPHTVAADLEVEVPVSVAYNQWTQFEEFPSFMDGVEEVTQLDDTRLHWVVSVGGRRAEWHAKILEQQPDERISWISEDGRKTRGTVTFEALGPNRTRVHLSLGYQTQGFAEAVGSAAGFERRRIEGDLRRFKELIESRGTETGAWRGQIDAGTTGS